jgi:hypothetical protein
MLKMKERKKFFQENAATKQAGVAIFIFYKADFTSKLVRRGKESHFFIDKVNNSLEDFSFETYTY